MTTENSINFGYSFHQPHRITLSRPSASQKTLVDIERAAIHMAWSYRSLLDCPNNVWQAPTVDWHVDITAFIDGEKAEFCDWQRIGGWYPGFALRVASE